MSIGSFLSRAVPVAIGYATGGPIGAAKAAATTEVQKKQERQVKQQVNARRQQEMEMMNNSGGVPNIPLYQPQMQAQSTQNSGFLGSLGQTFRDIGSTVSDFFSIPGTSQLLGSRAGSSLQPAIDRQSQRGQETSGTSQAFMGNLLPAISAAGRFLKSPTGAAVGGGIAGLLSGGLDMQSSGMRITKKMKSQVRSVLNITGGDIGATANFLGLSTDQVMMILLKRFRNDGPVVTKAALRKTKTTIRRLKHMCDVYDDMRAPAKRRAPMRRATRSTTLIKN